MAKLTKRVLDGLQADGAATGTLYWDSELKEFGVRVFPSGTKKFVAKFRTKGGRQRWLKIGTFGAMTAEQARERAKIELAKVSAGEDPAHDRDQFRASITVAQMCDRYMEVAEAGLVLGRKGTPKKASTLATDRSRIDVLKRQDAIADYVFPAGTEGLGIKAYLTSGALFRKRLERRQSARLQAAVNRCRNWDPWMPLPYIASVTASPASPKNSARPSQRLPLCSAIGSEARRADTSSSESTCCSLTRRTGSQITLPC